MTAAVWRKSIKARGWEIEALLRDFEAAEADNAILRTAQKSVLSSRDAWKAQAEGLKTVQQDIIDGALHDVSERCVAAEAEAQAEAQRREAAEARVKEFEAFVRRADAQQSKALEMLRKVGYVYNNPEDMMQKLAFSLYTYLVEISQWARAELDDVAPAPQERGGEGA